MSEHRIVSVSKFLSLVNETLRLIPSQEFVVEGEVSDFRVAQEKWVSFDLKDEEGEAVLKCFMTTWQLHVPVEDGMRVQVQGFSKVYERFGQFKMNVQEISPVGEGALRRAYELLKKKLEEEGLFDRARKRALPRFPKTIGLITSRDAAAYGDFLRILNNRWSGVMVMHANVHVQGREAAPEIIFALSAFSALSNFEQPDVLVLTRGGGGLEDIHAFNDEQVARAVFGSKIPVVCAVGHERDESLCDFVADVRASTPSNAAERVVPNRADVLYEIETMSRHLETRLRDATQQQSFAVERAMQMMSLVLGRQKESFVFLERRFREALQHWIPDLRNRLNESIRLLRQLDPTRVLSRGYSIVRLGQRVLREASSLEIGSCVSVQLATGSFDADVTRVDGKVQQRLV
jgi:exodeoxyribonuclease VII large subunit